MAASQILSAQQSQVVANLSVLTGGSVGTITSFVLHPRIGPAQLMTMRMVIDAIEAEIEIIYHDQAFEGRDLFGSKKGEGPRQGEPNEGI